MAKRKDDTPEETTGPANVPGGVMSMEPGTYPGKEVSGTPLPELDEPAPQFNAAARLRAFEDENFGPDAVRIEGKVERGSGSPWSQMSPARKAHYEAIERMVATEQKLADAHAALMQADADHEEATAAAARAESEANAPADK